MVGSSVKAQSAQNFVCAPRAGRAQNADKFVNRFVITKVVGGRRLTFIDKSDDGDFDDKWFLMPNPLSRFY